VCRLSELKREISSQTEIAQDHLLLIHHRYTLNMHSETETETVGEVFPKTSEEFPVVVSSIDRDNWSSVSRIKPSLREFTLYTS